MTTQNKKYVEVDVSSYGAYGLPLLAFLSIIGVSALIAVGIYEWLI